MAALNHDQLVAYLFADLSDDPLHGRGAWVRLAGHALSDGVDAEWLRDLYTAAAGRWLEQGCFDHRVFIPAGDVSGRRAWFRLGFGANQSYALLDLTAQVSDPVKLPAGLEIRRAGPEDRAVLEQMSDIIARHQALAPAWVATDSTTLSELREGFAKLAADPDVTVWLAFQNGEAVGYQAFFKAPPAADDLITPERCGELKVAGTVPGARGIGVGSALTRHGLAHERTKGFEVCLTDWHVPNLTSSRFWPKWGFVPVVQRLRRRVDERALGSEV